MATWCLACLFLVPCQDPPVRDLVERMRAESADLRHQAFHRLDTLGPGAEPELRIAAGDADPEIAARSRTLLRSLDLRRSIPPGILQEFPDLPERAAVDPAVWRDLLEEAQQTTPDGPSLHPRLTRADHEFLAAQALDQARTQEDALYVFEAIRDRSLLGALPAVRSKLAVGDIVVRQRAIATLMSFRDQASVAPIAALLEDRGVRSEAVWALASFHRASVLPAVKGYLNHPDAQIRSAAMNVLRAVDSRDLVPLLVPRLEDADPDVRFGALQLLVRILGARAALPLVQRLLNGSDRDLSITAILALSNRSCPEFWPLLRPQLRSENEDDRKLVIDCAGETMCRDARDDLLECLQDPSPLVRSAAAEALTQLQDQGAVSDLLRLLTDPSELVREVGLRGLTFLGCSDLLPLLVGRLRDPNPQVRGTTLEWLEDRRWKQAGAEVARLLDDPDDKVRLQAIQTLERMDARNQAPRLLPLLLKPLDPDAEMAEAALQRWNLPELRPRLIDLCTHAEAEVRRRAAGVLALRAPVEAAPIFLKLLEDPDEEVRDQAILGIQSGEVRAAIPRLRVLLSDPKSNNAVNAAYALCRLKDWDSLGAILEAMSHHAELNCFIEQLGEFRSPELVAPLEPFLDSGDERVRDRVLRLFMDLDHPLATEALLRVTRIEGHPLRNACLTALAALEDLESVPELVGLLDHPSASLRNAAAYTLGEMGAREAIPSLLAGLEKDGPEPRQCFLQALCRLRAPEAIPFALATLRRERSTSPCDAIRAVERLSLGEALPDLIRLSQDDDLTVRPVASLALIRLGDPGEIPGFLERSSRHCFLLNRFRQPEVWERLRATSQPRSYRGTYGQALKAFAADAGLELDVAAEEDFLEEDLSSRINRRNGVATLLDALEELFAGQRVSFILDGNRLRLLRSDDADAFWKHWFRPQAGK